MTSLDFYTIKFQLSKECIPMFRDSFYEILREWENNHLTAGWSFTEVLGTRIKSLVTFGSDAITCFHLTRLFQAQLIAVSSG